jgi:acetolactate synthase I/II/III large subunit
MKGVYGLFEHYKQEAERTKKEEAFGARGLKIERPEEISSTLKKALAMQGPVIVGVPVDYRDNHRLMENVHRDALN